MSTNILMQLQLPPSPPLQPWRLHLLDGRNGDRGLGGQGLQVLGMAFFLSFVNKIMVNILP